MAQPVRNTLFAVLCLCTTGLQTAVANDNESFPKVGQSYPEIRLPRIDTREQVSLSQFRGKKVLLIHFASW